MSTVTREIYFVKRPVGMVGVDSFRIESSRLSDLAQGDVLVQIRYLSVDPYMRGRMNDNRSYVAPFALNTVMTGGAVGQVIQSRDPAIHEGDWVFGQLPWADYALVQGDGLKVLDSSLPPTTALHVLGLTGLTAYFGLLSVGAAKSGDTVVVSGAAGAVGSVVGQIAKIHGCHVIGIAGSDDKLRMLLDDYGFDGAINYKYQNVAQILGQITKGVDVYFDNVGGPISDAVISHINDFGRIAICGQIALYNNVTPDLAPRIILPLLLTRRATAQGFIVSDYSKDFKLALSQLGHWYSEGRLKIREDIVQGLEYAPQAFLRLFEGANLGKQLVYLP